MDWGVVLPACGTSFIATEEGGVNFSDPNRGPIGSPESLDSELHGVSTVESGEGNLVWRHVIVAIIPEVVDHTVCFVIQVRSEIPNVLFVNSCVEVSVSSGVNDLEFEGDRDLSVKREVVVSSNHVVLSIDVIHPILLPHLLFVQSKVGFSIKRLENELNFSKGSVSNIGFHESNLFGLAQVGTHVPGLVFGTEVARGSSEPISHSTVCALVIGWSVTFNAVFSTFEASLGPFFTVVSLTSMANRTDRVHIMSTIDVVLTDWVKDTLINLVIGAVSINTGSLEVIKSNSVFLETVGVTHIWVLSRGIGSVSIFHQNEQMEVNFCLNVLRLKSVRSVWELVVLVVLSSNFVGVSVSVGYIVCSSEEVSKLSVTSMREEGSISDVSWSKNMGNEPIVLSVGLMSRESRFNVV
jgi:hypothetical protein